MLLLAQPICGIVELFSSGVYSGRIRIDKFRLNPLNLPLSLLNIHPRKTAQRCHEYIRPKAFFVARWRCRLEAIARPMDPSPYYVSVHPCRRWEQSQNPISRRWCLNVELFSPW
jgi:hypothetical protein